VPPPPTRPPVPPKPTMMIVSELPTKPATKPKPIRVVPTHQTRVTLREQLHKELIDELKATFMEWEERKRLGVKDYRFIRPRKNKERVNNS
jgi:hypothetical protein